jgi:hypothetical protein
MLAWLRRQSSKRKSARARRYNDWDQKFSFNGSVRLAMSKALFRKQQRRSKSRTAIVGRIALVALGAVSALGWVYILVTH